MLIQIQSAQGMIRTPTAPADAGFHLFETESGTHLLMVDGSRVYSLPQEVAEQFKIPGRDSGELVTRYGLEASPYIDDRGVEDPPVRAISLAIAQVCNLGCVYCYAQKGSFGGENKSMARETALGAVDLLLREAAPGERVQLSFLGGEPMANRGLLREATEYANALADTKGVSIGFSITTNGTLVNESDAEFFEHFGFGVTVSIDGIGEVHDRQRPFKDGSGSYSRTMDRVKPLLERQRRMQVSARVTVTPQNLGLTGTLEELLELGFHSVGFSPTLSSPDGAGQMDAIRLREMLKEMIECGRVFEQRTIEGRRYPFLNMSNALREIHRGTHRPYPCGAGAGYFGISAGGGIYACHRFVDDPVGEMGDLKTGINRAKRNRWLADRHVNFQEPCSNCWARYLCGGGCHHEVLKRGRSACDYIRGWLEYSLQAYVRLLEECPGYFSGAGV